MRVRLVIAVVGLGAALLVGQARAAPAQVSGAPPPEDPFEATNRTFFSAQQGLDRGFFLPLAKLYHALTPGPIGKAIHNFLTNLSEPTVIANDILQARFRDAGRATLRLTANSTAGWLGVMDVAAGAGIPRKDTDFGVTLGVWGLGPGPYLYLPFIGPTTTRDLVGIGGEVALNPLTWTRFPGHETLLVSSSIVGGLDTRIRAEPGLEAILGTATDPYATLRSVYLQNREAQVRGSAAAPELPPLEDEPSATPETPPADRSPATSPDQAEPSADQPGPPPSASAVSPAQLASADDPDAPIATARPFDLDGASGARAADGA